MKTLIIVVVLLLTNLVFAEYLPPYIYITFDGVIPINNTCHEEGDCSITSTTSIDGTYRLNYVSQSPYDYPTWEYEAPGNNQEMFRTTRTPGYPEGSIGTSDIAWGLKITVTKNYYDNTLYIIAATTAGSEFGYAIFYSAAEVPVVSGCTTVNLIENVQEGPDYCACSNGWFYIPPWSAGRAGRATIVEPKTNYEWCIPQHLVVEVFGVYNYPLPGWMQPPCTPKINTVSESINGKYLLKYQGVRVVDGGMGGILVHSWKFDKDGIFATRDGIPSIGLRVLVERRDEDWYYSKVIVLIDSHVPIDNAPQYARFFEAGYFIGPEYCGLGCTDMPNHIQSCWNYPNYFLAGLDGFVTIRPLEMYTLLCDFTVFAGFLNDDTPISLEDLASVLSIWLE